MDDLKTLPVISVIIPSYNAAGTIRDQLNALAKQECSDPWEVIIADNGSTDNTIEIVKEFNNRIPNLSIVAANEKSGAAYARNKAAAQARGEYIAYCDADDEVGEGWLQAILHSVKIHGFVASKMDAFKLSDPRAAKLKKSRQTKDLIQYTYVPYLPHAGASGLAVRKELHDSVGGFDERFGACEDCDYCWKIQQNGTALHFEENALIHIRHRGTVTQRFRQAIKWGAYNVLLVKLHVPKGMPRPKFNDMLRQWKYIFELLPKLSKRINRDRLSWAFGYRLGQIIGSIRYRYPAL